MNYGISVPKPKPRILNSVRVSLHGSNQDYTVGSINRSILMLAIPMAVEGILQSLFDVVDLFWVGRLGANGVAAIGLTESLLAVVFAVGLGLSLSTTAVVARRIGEKLPGEAAIAAVQAIQLGLLISMALGICGGMAAPELLRATGASASVVTMGANYSRIALGGCGAIVILLLNNAILRGAGDAALAMRIMWISNGVNMVLAPCLIFGWGPFPRFGVAGAALATLAARLFGILCQTFWLMRGTGRIRILGTPFRFHPAVLQRLLRLSLPGIVQFTVINASWIVLVRIVALNGAPAVASYTVSILIFFLMPAWGLSNAAATLVGQNLGAGQPDRAEQIVWRAGFFNMLFLGVLGAFLFVFATPLVRIFLDDPEVASNAAVILRILVCGNIGYAQAVVILQAFNGAGDTLTPLIVNFLGFWILEIPLAWWLASQERLGAQGVSLSIVLTEFAIASISVLLFRRGRWKSQLV
jgi:putative MATE family efflux protein